MLSYVTEPEINPVCINELKSHLRIEHDVEDAYLENLIQTATTYVENVLKQSLIQRTYDYTSKDIILDDSMRIIKLPMGPVQNIIGVEHIRLDESTVGIRRYEERNESIAISPNIEGPVTVRYAAGFGIYPKHIPAPIKQAILMIAGECYENRHGFSMQNNTFFQELLAPYKKVSI